MKVTAADGKTTKTYAVTISRDDPSVTNADLRSITVSAGTLEPDFDPAITAYDVAVPYGVSSITISAASANLSAGVTGTGTIDLDVGTSSFNLVVLAADHETTKTYTIDVTRADAATTDATLKSLSVEGFSIDPAFAPETTSYSLTVPYETSSAIILASANNASAVLTNTGHQNLGVGANKIDIVVTAADGMTQKVYTVAITRQKSTNASLSSLTIGPGTLSPAFSPTTYEYDVSLAYGATSVTIGATADDPAASVSGTGVKNPQPGLTTPYSVVVTAAAGNSRAYTIRVARAAQSTTDATLSALSVIPGTLSPSFDSLTTSYYVSVPNSIDTAYIAATATNGSATVAGTGTKSLSVGQNPFAITVTAADKTTKKAYTVVITRAAPPSTNADLASLTPSGGTLTPGFSAGTTSYGVAVPYAIESITLSAAAADSGAKVAGAGGKTLVEGSNQFQITVTAADGTTSKTYTVTVTRAFKSTTDAMLSSLTVTGRSITPEFDPETTDYGLNVPYSVSSIEISAKPANPGASATGTGDKTLFEGPNACAIIVTAADHTTTKIYTIIVTRAEKATTDATLNSLSVDGHDIAPKFDPGVTAYNASVPYVETSATIAATPTSGSASLSGTGVKDNLIVGPNTFNIQVTAADGTTTRIYTIIITREKSTNANLSSLTLSGGTLNPAFSSGRYEYDVSIPYGVESITIGAAKEDSNASVDGIGTKNPPPGLTTSYVVKVTAAAGNSLSYTIRVARAAESTTDATLSALSVTGYAISPNFSAGAVNYTLTVPNAIPSVNIIATPTIEGASVSGAGEKNLSMGANACEIVVTATDGTTKKTYTIAITRADPPSTNADLASLTLSSGTLTPGFSAAETNYSASVPYATSSITISAIAADSGANIAGAGGKTLVEGSNQFQITVTAADGTTSKTYTVTVTRAAKATTDATLSSLAVVGRSIYPDFSSDILEYSLSVPYAVSSIDISASTTNPGASTTGTGNKALNEGPNACSIVVSAADHTTTKTYTINVTRADATTIDAKLKTLVIEGQSISPTFDPEKTAYTSSVPNTVSSVTITASTNNASATLTGAGPHDLNTGDNTITIEVTATDGTTKKAYTIIVNRSPLSANADLASLVTTPVAISPTFSASIYEYNVSLTYDAASISITATTADTNATMTGADTFSPPAGATTVYPIVVKAVAGNTQTYNIHVTRARKPALSLSGLTATGYDMSGASASVTLSPAFQSTVYSYTANVNWSVYQLVLEATLADATSQYTVDRTELAIGSNTITLTIEAADESTATITIMATRAASTLTISSPAANASISGQCVISGKASGSGVAQVGIAFNDPEAFFDKVNVNTDMSWSADIDVSAMTNGPKLLIATPLGSSGERIGPSVYVPVNVSGSSASSYTVTGTWSFSGSAPSTGTVLINAMDTTTYEYSSCISRAVDGLTYPQSFALPGIVPSSNQYEIGIEYFPTGVDPFTSVPAMRYSSTMTINGDTSGVALLLSPGA